jgi:outer membrane protein assembly factor BamA
MALVSLACLILCSAIAASTLDHAQSSTSANPTPQQESARTAQAAKFTLGDIKIDGDVPDANKVKDRLLSASKNRVYDTREELTEEVAERVRADFQERGYFRAEIQTPSSLPLGLTDGQQSLRVIVSIQPGEQFRLRNISIQSAAPDQPLSISAETIREQFHLHDGDLFNTTEIREGLNRVQQLYASRGYARATTIPDTEVDNASHRIDLTLRITEAAHKH